MSETDIQNTESRDLVISVTGVKIPREIYSEFRPLIQRSARIADDILKVIEPIVGLPADFINHHLNRFRDTYRKKIDDIPIEFLQTPPLRLGCVVLKDVAYVAEELELQDMFAKLLAAGSDSRLEGLAHPSFANVITQLSPVDARVISREWNPASRNEDDEKIAPESYATSIENLKRLGLLAVRYDQFGRSFFADHAAREFKDAIRQIVQMQNSRTHHYGVEDRIERAAKDLAKSVIEEVHNRNQGWGSELTDYGRNFAKICISSKQNASETMDGEQAAQKLVPRPPAYGPSKGGMF